MDERNNNHLGNGAINDGDCAWTKLRRSRHRPNAVADQQSIAKCLQNKCKLSRRSPVRTVQQSGPRRDDRNPSMATEVDCAQLSETTQRAWTGSKYPPVDGRSRDNGACSTDGATTTGSVRRIRSLGILRSSRWVFWVAFTRASELIEVSFPGLM